MFTYYNPVIGKLTNHFQNTNLKIAFHTKNIIHNILHNGRHCTIRHAHSDIYQLKCHTCNLSYIGQNGSRLELRLKEYIHYITQKNPQSVYVIHIVHNANEYGVMETTMTYYISHRKVKE
jgi:hypothetical protein